MTVKEMKPVRLAPPAFLLSHNIDYGKDQPGGNGFGPNGMPRP
jgi:hypothetical protein